MLEQFYCNAIVILVLNLQALAREDEKRGMSKQRDGPKNSGNVKTERQAEKMTKPIPRSLRYTSQA